MVKREIVKHVSVQLKPGVNADVTAPFSITLVLSKVPEWIAKGAEEIIRRLAESMPHLQIGGVSVNGNRIVIAVKGGTVERTTPKQGEEHAESKAYREARKEEKRQGRLLITAYERDPVTREWVKVVGATVYVDGVRVGRTPASGSLVVWVEPGKHRICIEHDEMSKCSWEYCGAGEKCEFTAYFVPRTRGATGGGRIHPRIV